MRLSQTTAVLWAFALTVSGCDKASPPPEITVKPCLVDDGRVVASPESSSGGASAGGAGAVTSITELPDPRTIGDSPKGLKNGAFAPELFHLDLASDGCFRLSDWTGPQATTPSGVVVVGFTASWCGPCKRSYPFLSEMQAEFGQDLKVVLVTTDATVDAKAKHAEIVAQSGLRAPLLDPSPHTLRAWLGQRRNVPHFYVINQAGEILVQDRGFGKKVRRVMPGQIRYALNNPEYVVRN